MKINLATMMHVNAANAVAMISEEEGANSKSMSDFLYETIRVAVYAHLKANYITNVITAEQLGALDESEGIGPAIVEEVQQIIIKHLIKANPEFNPMANIKAGQG